MKVLLDTNILLDYIYEREPYYENAKKIMTLYSDNKISACIAAHSITNMFYILRKNVPENERREMLKELCTNLPIIGMDKDKLIASLDNTAFRDMEDCLQSECAAEFGADYIITRNIKDFDKSGVQAIVPEEFIDMIETRRGE